MFHGLNNIHFKCKPIGNDIVKRIVNQLWKYMLGNIEIEYRPRYTKSI